MLQKLNERIQGVVAWVIIILIAITFSLFGIDYYIQSHHRSDAEVTINGEPIRHQAFETNYRRTRQMRDPSQITMETEKQLRQQVLDEMIVNKVSMQAASQHGFQISAEQANAAILAIPQFQQDGHFSAERYQQTLSGAYFTPESFFDEVKQGMLLNQVRFAMMGTAFVLPSELKRFVKLYMQTRDYQYLSIPADVFAKESKVTEKAIADYYEHHPSDFRNPEKVGIAYISLSASAIRKKIQLSDKAITAYYEQNKQSYKVPAQWKVAQIFFAYPHEATHEQKKEILEKATEASQALKNNPKQFPEMLKKLSDDTLSISKGGELPWITAGQTYMDKGLVSLREPGQISEPFVSKKGVQIFKLLEYKPSKTKQLAEVHDRIKTQLIADATQKAFADKLEKLTELAFQTPDTLEPIKEELKLPIQHSKPFTRQGTKTGLASNKQLVSAAFSSDVLEQENNSEPLQINNDEVIVLRVKEHITASEKPLAEVRDRIRQILEKKEAEEKLAEWGNALISGKKSYADLEKRLGKKTPVWKKLKGIYREADSVPEQVNHIAFSIPVPNQKDGRLSEQGEFILVNLNAIQKGKLQELDPEKKAALKQQLESNYGVTDYELYVTGAMQSAEIETDK